MVIQRYNTSDDRTYWDEQEMILSEPSDAVVVLGVARDKLSRYQHSSDPALRAMIPKLEATIARLAPIIDAETHAWVAAEEAEWTRDVTIDRRAAWNAAVRSGTYTVKGKLHVATLVKAMGFDCATLKHHVSRHGLT